MSVSSTLANEELSIDDKVDSLVKSAEKLEENHCWKTATKNNEDKSLKWLWNLGQYQQDNFHKLNDECSGKLPVEVFDMLFNSSIRDLIIKESTNYAKSTHNDANFAMTENELKQYVAVLFLAGYHSLPQQRLYWERCIDVDMPIVYKSISKNKFSMIKKYTHLSDNTTLDKADKYAKVRPLYNLTNASLKQFGYWHQNYAIDEQMIPYFGMHSAKQIMHNKSVQFVYKSFVSASSDEYPYHIIPYSGEKGVGGTPGKDLTVRVVSNLVLQFKEEIGNLTFDNWYPSTKLMSLLTVMDIPTICTVRDNDIGEVQIKSKSSMSKLERGEFNYAYDDVDGFHCVQWNDNSVVTTLLLYTVSNHDFSRFCLLKYY